MFRPNFKTGTDLGIKFRPTFWTHIVGGKGHIVQSARETDSHGATDWSQDEPGSSGQL